MQDTSFTGFGFEERAADVFAILDAIGVDGPVDVLGYSMGGGTALACGSLFPSRVRKLCLLAPSCVVTEEQLKETGEGCIR